MDKLIALVAKISNRSASKLSEKTTLRELGLSASLGLAILEKRIKELYGKDIPGLRWDLSLADVYQIAHGTQAPLRVEVKPSMQTSEVKSQPRSTSAASDWDIGIDLEEIKNMPSLDKVRSDLFYKETFTDLELTGALLKPNPLASLCGIFCAKEALRKSHDDFSTIPFSQLEIDHHTNGKPFIRVLGLEHLNSRPIKVSITHTDAYASAVVMVGQ
ncbi:hypothetical protein CIK05_08945 [Bdellovibrio sp. qaytius]|nr:hypothetical protein CIK05_08945 [Bdellovibrio sp. qaytius]